MTLIRLHSRPQVPPPNHVAIIMDGNGRWARARGLPRTAGHRRGVDAVRTTAETAVQLGVRYLTLFAFSSENWKRPLTEINELMRLLRYYLAAEIEFLQKNNIRLRIIGERSRLAPDIVAAIEDAEQATAENTQLTLVIALSYGGRAEIARAARELATKVKAGLLDPATIDETTLTEQLFTADIPDPDLLIRTSGERRISNFLIWQLAYTELLFVDTFWPDFSAKHLEDAVRDFQQRDRRYGTVVA